MLNRFKPYWEQDGNKIYQGDAMEVLKSMASESVSMCVTSPPYWGLRDYNLPPTIWDGDPDCKHVWGDENIKTPQSYMAGYDNEKSTLTTGTTKQRRKEIATAEKQQISQGQFCQVCGAWRGCLGLEPSPELFLTHMVVIFRELRRVLRKDGCLFLNIGDSYAGSGGPGSQYDNKATGGYKDGFLKYKNPNRKTMNGLKPKDLCGIPWRLALALQADGWWLRSAMPWVKRSSMPESCSDRPASALEYVFLLTKSQKYYFDMTAIRKKSADMNAVKKYNKIYENIHGETKSGQIKGNSEIQCKQTRESETERIQTIRGGEGIVQQMAEIRKGASMSSQIPKNRKTQSSFDEVHQNKKILCNSQEISTDKEGKRMPIEGDTQKESKPCELYQHANSRGMGTDKISAGLSMCNVWKKEEVNQGPYTTDQQRRPPCKRKHTGPLSLLQCEERKQRINSSGRNFRNTDLFFESLEPPFGAIFADDELVGLDINPKGFAGSHYAVFPQRIPEVAILAGTSERGCCSECGAAWKRIVEKTKTKDVGRISENRNIGQQQRKSLPSSMRDVSGSGWRSAETKTTGWKPSCSCNAKTTPCIVLDIFGGACTTAIVAHKLGRKFVMIELSKSYIDKIGIPRIEKETEQRKLW